MSIRVFVDVSDIYHKLNRYFDAKLDYELYLDRIEELYGPIGDTLIAYGSQSGNEAIGFITCLKGIGFTVKYKRPRIFTIGDREIKRCEWGVEISVDAISVVKDGDTVILGISNTDYIPLIKYLKSLGVKVIIFASHIPDILNRVADITMEITDDLFEEEKDYEN